MHRESPTPPGTRWIECPLGHYIQMQLLTKCQKLRPRMAKLRGDLSGRCYLAFWMKMTKRRTVSVMWISKRGNRSDPVQCFVACGYACS